MSVRKLIQVCRHVRVLCAYALVLCGCVPVRVLRVCKLYICEAVCLRVLCICVCL